VDGEDQPPGEAIGVCDAIESRMSDIVRGDDGAEAIDASIREYAIRLYMRCV
jgi:hypothetical protein